MIAQQNIPKFVRLYILEKKYCLILLNTFFPLQYQTFKEKTFSETLFPVTTANFNLQVGIILLTRKQS